MGIVKLASGQQHRGKPVMLCSESVPASYLLSASGIMPFTLCCLIKPQCLLAPLLFL